MALDDQEQILPDRTKITIFTLWDIVVSGGIKKVFFLDVYSSAYVPVPASEGSFFSYLTPHTVVEIFGVKNGHIEPDRMAKYFTELLGISSEQLTNKHRAIANIEVPEATIDHAVERMLKEMPPEMVNVVIKKRREVGEYTRIPAEYTPPHPKTTVHIP